MAKSSPNSFLTILLAILLISVFATFSFSQNLVPNPSFEEYNELNCGYTQNKTEFDQAISHWKMPTKGTPDFFSLMLPESCPNHPFNTSIISAGYQTPQSGKNMLGIITLVQNNGICPEYREYIQVELSTPLQPKQRYIAGFYISLADNKQYASNNLGMLFTEVAITSDSCSRLPFEPQVVFEQIIHDKKTGYYFISLFSAINKVSFLQLVTSLQIIRLNFLRSVTIYVLIQIHLITL